MTDYVIFYKENGIEYKTLWDGENAKEALHSFLASFDSEDRKKVTNVRIFYLVEMLEYGEDL